MIEEDTHRRRHSETCNTTVVTYFVSCYRMYVFKTLAPCFLSDKDLKRWNCKTWSLVLTLRDTPDGKMTRARLRACVSCRSSTECIDVCTWCSNEIKPSDQRPEIHLTLNFNSAYTTLHRVNGVPTNRLATDSRRFLGRQINIDYHLGGTR